MKTLSLIVLAAVGMSLQTNASNVSTFINSDESSIANSLAPSGFFNADAVSDSSSLFTTGAGSVSTSFMDASVSGKMQMNGNPSRNFSAIAASSTGFNNSGTETIKVLPEPTTLALTTLGGLSALVFTRHFRKSSRA